MSAADVDALRGQYLRACAREPWGEAAAVAVFLGCRRIAGDTRLCCNVSPAGVDWDGVLAFASWSPSERFVIATAAALWTGRPTLADMSRVVFLDEGFYAVWQAMLAAARTGRPPKGGAR